MRFLVIGCNGMAGHVISIYLKEHLHDVVGYARKESRFVNTIVGDVKNLELLKETIKKGNFNAVINCVGILNDFAENNHEEAIFVNSYIPHFLVSVTKDMKTQIIQISTDCVFSGNKGGYREKDLQDGRTFYDRSKALGEIDNEKDITFRNSIVGPDLKETGIGLLNWFMKQSDTINGFTKSIWTGQTTLQLAKTIEVAAIKKAHGLFNMVPESSISKFDLLKLFNKYLREDSLYISPIDGVIADKTLTRTNYDFDYNIPDYETMIKELAEWMRYHKDIYPHYKL